jgi:hypothetical protein
MPTCAARWAQMVECHDPLTAFVVDSQMPGYAAMPISRVFLMHGFNLSFQGKVFGDLFGLTINIFAVDAQCLCPKLFVPDSLDYFDFF